ncbi:hypothetical protein [Lysobacter gummosus]|uniref:hypothetical protein n=1 Tax=Lysobacter gummosus TaxID=262324 RepID=UPI003644270C
MERRPMPVRRQGCDEEGRENEKRRPPVLFEPGRRRCLGWTDRRWSACRSRSSQVHVCTHQRAKQSSCQAAAAISCGWNRPSIQTFMREPDAPMAVRRFAKSEGRTKRARARFILVRAVCGDASDQDVSSNSRCARLSPSGTGTPIRCAAWR